MTTACPPRRDPADWDREYLLDIAAAATRDSWELVGCRDLVEAICVDYGSACGELSSRGNPSISGLPQHVNSSIIIGDSIAPLGEDESEIAGDSNARRGVAQSIHDLVCSGRITPEQGAWLYELRRLIAWRRRPWWDRAITRLIAMLGGRP